MVARAGVKIPDQKLLQQVLRENGYDGKIGIPLLYKNYGKVVSCEGSPVLAFFGVHIGKQNQLMSARSLWWKHFFLRRSMNAGFFGCMEMPEFYGLEKLRNLLGTNTEIDVVGCTSNPSMQENLSQLALRPSPFWWLGIWEGGWLHINLDFYSLETYQSLSDLLHERNRVEIYLK